MIGHKCVVKAQGFSYGLSKILHSQQSTPEKRQSKSSLLAQRLRRALVVELWLSWRTWMQKVNSSLPLNPPTSESTPRHHFLSSLRGVKNDLDNVIFTDRRLILLANQWKKIGWLQFAVNYIVANWTVIACQNSPYKILNSQMTRRFTSAFNLGTEFWFCYSRGTQQTNWTAKLVWFAVNFEASKIEWFEFLLRLNSPSAELFSGFQTYFAISK